VKQVVPGFHVSRAQRRAGELVSTVVEEVVIAVGQGRPDHLRDGIEPEAEFLRAAAERFFLLDTLGDIAEKKRHIVVRPFANRKGIDLEPAIERLGVIDKTLLLARPGDGTVALEPCLFEARNSLPYGAVEHVLSKPGVAGEGRVQLGEAIVDRAVLDRRR
jgi:hypothetical protein